MSMGIYIPGIKLPKDEPGAFQVVVMYVGADGKLRAECDGTHEVVLVPPHGRLIDADSLMRTFKDEKGSYYGYESAVKGEAIEAAPTVIEAEGKCAKCGKETEIVCFVDDEPWCEGCLNIALDPLPEDDESEEAQT